jgi:hypothetical protein
MLRVENKDPVVRSRRTKESVEVDDDLGRKRGGAGGMKDSQPGIIVHDQGILRERFATVRAAFRETLNPCPKALFVVEDEHMAFSYTDSWKLARSATSLALLKKSVRNGQGADKGLCQLDGSIRVNHVTVHTLPEMPFTRKFCRLMLGSTILRSISSIFASACLFTSAQVDVGSTRHS